MIIPLIYSVDSDNVTITTKTGKDIPKQNTIHKTHTCIDINEPYSQYMNRIIRKEDILVVTGNVPSIMMGSTISKNTHQSGVIGFGEINFSLIIGDTKYLFTDSNIIDVRHFTCGTEWTINFNEIGIVFILKMTLIDDYGMAICLDYISQNDIGEFKLNLTLQDMVLATRNTLNGVMFPKDSSQLESQLYLVDKKLECNGFFSTLESKKDDFNILYGIWSYSDPEIIVYNTKGNKDRLSFESLVNAKANEKTTVLTLSAVKPFNYELLCKNPNEIKGKQLLVEQQYSDMLMKSKINTGIKEFDGGFHNAVLTLDYAHKDKAWLEGFFWICYFTNNYQISAAIALGQYERAKTALILFGSLKDGYNIVSCTYEILDRSQKPDKSYALGFDGLPYYIYQLYQYTHHTGDLSVMETVADHVHINMLELIELCDYDNDDCYSWHRGCNMFMYQADHLGVSGKGASPTLMMCAVFAMFSELFYKIKREDLGAFYHEKHQKTFNALSNLWNDEKGYYNTIDIQGYTCSSHYYTDLIFPLLYTLRFVSVKESDAFINKCLLSLDHLKSSLVFKSDDTGKLLMRVGDFKPDLFGNNNVMPVQMAEAARAFFMSGDILTGYSLLDSCCYATSIYTDSPGSAPERMNDLGFGEVDYMFGNPAASIIYSVIDSLFGIHIDNYGTELVFQPALTFISEYNSKLNQASLNLPYINVSFVRTGNKCTYTLKLPSSSSISDITLNTFIESYESMIPKASKIVYFTVNDIPHEFSIKTKYKGKILSATIPLPLGNEMQKAIAISFEYVPGYYNMQISDYFNAESIIAVNAWRGNQPFKVGFKDIKPDGLLYVDSIYYKTELFDGINAKLCIIEYGRSDDFEYKIERSQYPDLISYNIERTLSGISLLYITETEVRLTNEQVGYFTLDYQCENEPDIVQIPIIEGINAGSLFGNYASVTYHVPLNTGHPDSANHFFIPCDDKRVLSKFNIKLYRADIKLGLIAINLY